MYIAVFANDRASHISLPEPSRAYDSDTERTLKQKEKRSNMIWEANQCNSCCQNRKEDWQTDVSATACMSTSASNVQARICPVLETPQGHVMLRSDSSLSASVLANNNSTLCFKKRHPFLLLW